MKVREAMARTISTAGPQDTIQHVAQLMKKEDAGFIPIVQDGSLIGVITDRDIVLRCIADAKSDILKDPVSACMSKDVVSVSPDADLEEAARLMNQKEIRRLPVVEGNKVVGVLSHGNLVQAAHSEGPADTATLGVTRGA
jgi:CBS domain-containing protein